MFRHEIVGKDVIEERRGKVDMLDRLFVCEGCFKYEKEGEKAWQHREVCGRLNAEAEEDEDGCLAQVPGKRIYTHGSDAVWSVWEVDGEVDSVSSSEYNLLGQEGANLMIFCTALLSMPLPLWQALPRQQIRLLRRPRFPLLSPGPHGPSNKQAASGGVL
jgi:hypothetical protein